MTSKEALDKLLFYSTLDDSGFEPTMKDYASVIEKDLLLLELIKENCYVSIEEIQGNYYLFIGSSIKGAKPLTKEQVEMLMSIKESKNETI